MQSRSNRFTAILLVVAVGIMSLASTVALAQTDGRINTDVYMGGANVYCVDSLRAPAATYAGSGGILVIDASGGELLFVPEAAIDAGFAEVAQTGQYATLGVSEQLWYGEQPVALYLLPTEEFQLNIFDEYEKLVEFRWTECGLNAAPPPVQEYTTTADCDAYCRDWSRGTNDGCLPGWDWHKDEQRCVFDNLY